MCFTVIPIDHYSRTAYGKRVSHLAHVHIHHGASLGLSSRPRVLGPVRARQCPHTHATASWSVCCNFVMNRAGSFTPKATNGPRAWYVPYMYVPDSIEKTTTVTVTKGVQHQTRALNKLSSRSRFFSPACSLSANRTRHYIHSLRPTSAFNCQFFTVETASLQDAGFCQTKSSILKRFCH